MVVGFFSRPFAEDRSRLERVGYPDRLCIYHEGKLLTRHTRCYDRHQDFENPDHPKPLLAKRRKAKTQMIYKRFLALSPRAEEYHEALAAKRFNPASHVRKIVGLSEIYGSEDVKRAMDDAFLFQAFSSEYIANILEQRNREVKKPGVLHLTRSQDLLNLETELPDMSVYKAQGGSS